MGPLLDLLLFRIFGPDRSPKFYRIATEGVVWLFGVTVAALIGLGPAETF